MLKIQPNTCSALISTHIMPSESNRLHRTISKQNIHRYFSHRSFSIYCSNDRTWCPIHTLGFLYLEKKHTEIVHTTTSAIYTTSARVKSYSVSLSWLPERQTTNSTKPVSWAFWWVVTNTRCLFSQSNGVQTPTWSWWGWLQIHFNLMDRPLHALQFLQFKSGYQKIHQEMTYSCQRSKCYLHNLMVLPRDYIKVWIHTLILTESWNLTQRSQIKPNC
jgi:hypothetical protein